MCYKINVLLHLAGLKKQDMRIRLRSHKTIGPQASDREVMYFFGPVYDLSVRRFSVLCCLYLLWSVVREHNLQKGRETLASQKH